jgi:hypothetical protein
MPSLRAGPDTLPPLAKHQKHQLKYGLHLKRAPAQWLVHHTFVLRFWIRVLASVQPTVDCVIARWGATWDGIWAVSCPLGDDGGRYYSKKRTRGPPKKQKFSVLRQK